MEGGGRRAMVLADPSPDVSWQLFFVVIIAAISLIGVIAALWGLFRLRRTHFRPGAYQRLVRSLLMWRLLEEDPTGEYLHAERLILVWAHAQGLSAITSGAGVVAAGILASCAVLFVPLSAHPVNTRSAFQPLLVFMLIAFHMLMVGALIGCFLGYVRAFRRQERDSDGAPMRPRFGVGAYRASWLLWLVLAVVALESTVFAPFPPAALWHASAAQLVVSLVLPAITISEIMVLEAVARAFCRMPLAHLPGPQEADDQRRERVYAFLVTVIFCSQIVMLPLLACSQYLAWGLLSPPHSDLPAPFGYAFLPETFGSMMLIGLLGNSGGRLGGSSTGWPWRPAPSTQTT
jgi:hypothetical protein